MLNHIKFYGINDFSAPMQVEMLGDFLKKFNAVGYDSNDVNFVLELVNLIKFMNEPIFYAALSEETKKLFDEKKGLIYSGINNYFRGLDNVSLAIALKDVDYDYLDDFLDEFAKICLRNITGEDFKKAWLESGKHDFYLFKNKIIVNAYANLCKEIFLNKPSNIELLLENCTDSSGSYEIPSNISRQEMYQLCIAYVRSDRANPKFLDVLLRSGSVTKQHLIIDADLLFAVKVRKKEIESKAIQENGVTTHWGLAIYSKRIAYEKAIQNKEPNDTVILLDEEWLDYDCGFSTILNSLRYVYGMFTMDAISMLPSFPNLEMGLMDILGEFNTKRTYKEGLAFKHKQNISFSEIRMLDILLSERHISILNIIKWFYGDYCQKEFNVKWLSFPLPIESEKAGNKTATLFRAEENIRKQYYVYCKKGRIDNDFMDCLNTPDFIELLSLNNRLKYVYFSDDSVLEKNARLLFSSQSGLGTTKTGKVAENLYELLRGGNFFVNDFYDYQQPQIRGLIDAEIIGEYTNGLGLGKMSMIKMLYQLFHIGAICLWYLDDDDRDLIGKWKDDNLVTYDDKLFSKPEIDYLNYILNNSMFDNSLALRNKYQHGFDTSDETELQFDYCMALLIHIMYIIKINDEFIFQLSDVDRKKFNCNFVEGF